MLTDAIKLTQIVIGRYHFTGFCGHQLWYLLAHPTTHTAMDPLGGFPIEIETQISKLITYSIAIFMS